MEWNFGNGIKWNHRKRHDEWNTGELLQEHVYAYEGKERAQEITGIINKIIKHPFVQMKPGNAAYIRVVTPEVDVCM